VIRKLTYLANNDVGRNCGAFSSTQAQGLAVDGARFAYCVFSCSATNLHVACSTPVASKPKYRFAGFSSTAVTADNGLLALNSACQQDFGTSARVSFTEDILRSPALSPIASSGWIKPTPAARKDSEILGSSYATCDGWSSPAANGLVLDGTDFSISTAVCTNTLPVACYVPE